MTSSRTPCIEIADTVFEPGNKSKKVQYRMEGSQTLYKVWIHLTGSDLPYVRGVSYKLHHTFPQPERFVQRTPSNPNCALTIWTWGIFEVQARVDMESGEQVSIVHTLKYDRQLKQAGHEDFAEE
jgi:transcription initiation factor IIF auxiliary subunit